MAARAALALILLLGTHAALAADERWKIVAGESSAQFRVRVLGIMPLAGAFAAPTGAIVIDREARTGSVEAVIRSDTVTMANPKNAEWARSSEFFDAARHPEIRFSSERFPLSLLAEGGELRGTLELRGHAQAVTFLVEPGRCDLDVPDGATDAAPTPRGGQCEVAARGAIRRSAFGMVARRAVADRVVLRLRIVGRVT